MGGRSYQGDQIQAVFFTRLIKFCFFFKWYIWQDQSIHADLSGCLKEAVGSVGIDHVGIGHKYQWNLCIFTDFPYHIKDLVGSHATA